MNDETKKHLQKLESDLSALRIILDSPPHDGRHAEAQSAFRVARLTFTNLKDALDDAPEPVPASMLSRRIPRPYSKSFIYWFELKAETCEDVAEAQGVAPAKPDIETPISATVRDALERVLERIAREALGQ